MPEQNHRVVTSLLYLVKVPRLFNEVIPPREGSRVRIERSYSAWKNLQEMVETSTLGRLRNERWEVVEPDQGRDGGRSEGPEIKVEQEILLEVTDTARDVVHAVAQLLFPSSRFHKKRSGA